MFIGFNQNWYAAALEEQKNRAPFMLTKFSHSEARKAGQLRGLVIQHHVSGWFKHNYPDQFLEAENFRQWEQKCSHDFRLKIGNQMFHIDVSGPRKDGTFGSYVQKPKKGVDCHIVCSAVGFKSWDECDFSRGFVIIGVLYPQDFRYQIDKNKYMDFFTWIKSIGL